jgi:hypothetical protein
MSQLAEYRGFGIAGDAQKNLMHIFPVAKGITSPYPVAIKLWIFGREIGFQERIITEGRCGQPGGVWYEDQFPELTRQRGLFGCGASIITKQSHISLMPSQCIFELYSENRSVRYRPGLKLTAEVNDRTYQNTVNGDPRISYSVVLVNTSANGAVRSEVFASKERIAALQMPSYSVNEVPLFTKDPLRAVDVSVTAQTDGTLLSFLISRIKNNEAVISISSFNEVK